MGVHLIACAGNSFVFFGPVFILVQGLVYIIMGISGIKVLSNFHTLKYWKILGFFENNPQIAVNWEFLRIDSSPA
jgi:hypothetical protein